MIRYGRTSAGRIAFSREITRIEYTFGLISVYLHLHMHYALVNLDEAGLTDRIRKQHNTSHDVYFRSNTHAYVAIGWLVD